MPLWNSNTAADDVLKISAEGEVDVNKKKTLIDYATIIVKPESNRLGWMYWNYCF